MLPEALTSHENAQVRFYGEPGRFAIRAPTISWEYLSLVHALEDQRAIGTTKAEAVGNSVLNVVLLSHIWH